GPARRRAPRPRIRRRFDRLAVWSWQPEHVTLGRDGGEIQVLGDASAVLAERVREQPNPPLRLVQVGVVQIDVEQVDVPGQLHVVHDIGLHDLAGDRQGRALRDVVHVAVAGALQLVVLLFEQRLEQLAREGVARLHTDLVVLGQRRPLVQPLPQDAQADLAGGHVLHQIQHIVVAAEVGRLQRRGLQPLQERVAVLERDAEQVAGAADRARRVLEQDQAVSVAAVVGERRELPAKLILLADLLPDRPDDVDHLPVGDPLAAGAFALFALAAGDRALHRAGDAGFRADRDVGLHTALPQRVLTLLVRRVDGAPY